MRSTENQNAAFGFSIYKNFKNGVIKDLFSFTNQDILPEAYSRLREAKFQSATRGTGNECDPL